MNHFLIFALSLLIFACTGRTTKEGMTSNKGYVMSEDGLKIAYDDAGTGSTALVLIHGWSCDKSYWRYQIDTFSKTYRVIAIDVAGHGESDIGRKDYTMQSFGADVAAVAHELQLKDMILIGHSMGGDVILEAARRLPGRVRALIWVDTYRQLKGGRSTEEVEMILAPLKEDFVTNTRKMARAMFHPGANDTLVEQIVMDMSSALPSVAKDALFHALSYSREVNDVLAELNLTVYAINPADPPGDIESMKRQGVNVIYMHGVSHFPMLEDPEQFNQVLAQLVEGMTIIRR